MAGGGRATSRASSGAARLVLSAEDPCRRSTPTPGARVVELEARKELALWHFSYDSVSDMVEKANRYSTVEATQRAARRRRRPSASRAFRAGVMRTWREYLLGRGYRDGWVGMTVAFSRSFYRYIEKVKQWDEPQVSARMASYARAKARLLEGYGPGVHVPDDDGATETQATEDPPRSLHFDECSRRLRPGAHASAANVWNCSR